jgi:hypothetical protein
MDRQLAELDRIEFGVEPVRRSPLRREVFGAFAVLAVVVGLLGTWLLGGVHVGSQSRVAHSRTALGTAGPHRLLPAVIAPAGATDYTVIDAQSGARWDPCRPIHYVVRRGDEPAAYDTMLRQAIADVSRATGLKFVADGTATEVLPYTLAERPLRLPQMYGDRWAPVLIAWANPGELPALAGATEGYAGPRPAETTPGFVQFVSGAVTYNVDGLRRLSDAPRGARMVRVVLLHELGHLVGLGHAHAHSEVMFKRVSATSPASFAPSDLAGLAAMGQGACS